MTVSPSRMLPILGVFVSVALGCVTPPPLEEGNYFLLAPTGLSVSKPVVSLREQRYQAIVQQRFDFSCGAASLATVLVYYYDDFVDEEEVVLTMLEDGDQDRIRREGFSLLDMSHYAESRGYQAKGFQVKPDALDRLAIPAITLVNTSGYSHFVVLKGLRDDTVFLADPALGQRTMRRADFLEEWSGVLFFVAAKRDPGAVSPLEELNRLAQGPKALVNELSYQGLRNITFDPLEF